MADEVATHVHCLEDNSYTEIEDGDEPDDTPCAQCEDEGREDPYCTVPVAIVPCPNGITARDWAPGGYIDPERTCDDEFHEPRSGNHVSEVER